MNPLMQQCQACEQNTATITEPCDHPSAPYLLCPACHRRLQARALRPVEWFNLAKRFGWWQFLLHDDFYDEDGTACQPDEDVDLSRAHAAPTLSDVATNTARLFDFTVSRWSIDDALAAAWARQEAGNALAVVKRGFAHASNSGVRDVALEVAAVTLQRRGELFVREAWARWPADVGLHALIRASAACLPHQEGFDRATTAIATLSGRELREGMSALTYFQSRDTLAWIEAHLAEPSTEHWGNLAAASALDWDTASRWLRRGRPWSLVAIDALLSIAEPRTPVLKSIQPALLQPPAEAEFVATLNAYVTQDDVPRVRQRVQALIGKASRLCVN